MKQTCTYTASQSKESSEKNERVFFVSKNEQNSPFFSPVIIQPKRETGHSDVYVNVEEKQSKGLLRRAPEPLIQTKCDACGEDGKLLQDNGTIGKENDFQKVHILPGGDVEHTVIAHTDGPAEDDRDMDAGPEFSSGSLNLGAQTTSPRTCPSRASLNEVRSYNHANLPANRRAEWRTYLGAVTRMKLHPGPDHSAHCMYEELSLLSNNCPTALTNRTRPCSASACLPVGSGGRDGNTRVGLSAGPDEFLDQHVSRSANVSFLEGTGVNSCSYSCMQRYRCDNADGARVAGDFLITRTFRAGTFTPPGGTPVHITTGTVEKFGPPPPPVPGDYPLRTHPEGIEYA